MTGLTPFAPGKGGRLCLIFQWDPSSWETAPGLWDALFSWLEERPACWNLPALPPGLTGRRRASILKPLLARLRPEGDSVASLGFSGAPHRLLNVDELGREVSWGLKNPWETGIVDALDLQPRILIPRDVDLVREDAWKVYRDNGFRLVGVQAEGMTSRIPTPAEGCLWLLPICAVSWNPGSAKAQRLRRTIARGASRGSDAGILVDLSGVTDAAVLKGLLEGPSSFLSGLNLPLSPLREPASDLPPRPPVPFAFRPGSALTEFTLPEARAALESTAALSRKKRKKNEEFRTLLVALGEPRNGTAFTAPEASRKGNGHLQLVAHMLGEVSLAGSAFDVRLRGGRFSGVVRKGTELLPNRPARSFFRVGRSTRALRTVSSVSFESDHGTGLREELSVADGEPSIARIQYAFVDGSSELLLSLDADFPSVPAGVVVSEYAPLAIALRLLRRNETAAIEAVAPDGSTSSIGIAEPDGDVLVPGSQHRIRRSDGGWIVLGFSVPGGPAWGLPSFRIVRMGRHRVLECNPLGSVGPFPVDAGRGAGTRLSLTLGIE